MRVRERQLFRIADQRGQDHTLVGQTITPHAQHRFVDIGGPNLSGCADLFRKGNRQIARYGMEIACFGGLKKRQAGFKILLVAFKKIDEQIGVKVNRLALHSGQLRSQVSAYSHAARSWSR